MDCFGCYEENDKVCVHCDLWKQCRSFRTSSMEEIEAAVLEETLVNMEVGEVSYISTMLMGNSSEPVHQENSIEWVDDPNGLELLNNQYQPLTQVEIRAILERLSFASKENPQQFTSWENVFILGVKGYSTLTFAQEQKLQQIWSKFNTTAGWL